MDRVNKKAKGRLWQNCSERLLQNMVSLEQQRFEWRRADKSSNLIDFPSSCVFVNSNNAFIFHYAGSLGAINPSGKNPLSGPMRGWLCLEVIIPWKCYQPYAMNSSISPLNEELTSL